MPERIVHNPIHYPPRTQLDSARYWLYEQREFMAQRGTNLTGYLAFYLPGSDDDRAEYRRVVDIYEADFAMLRNCEARVRDLEANPREARKRV